MISDFRHDDRHDNNNKVRTNEGENVKNMKTHIQETKNTSKNSSKCRDVESVVFIEKQSGLTSVDMHTTNKCIDEG